MGDDDRIWDREKKSCEIKRKRKRASIERGRQR